MNERQVVLFDIDRQWVT